MYLDDIEDDVIYTLADVESSFSIPKMKLIKYGFVAQINFELGFSLTHYLSRNTLCRWRTQMSETV